MIGVLGKNCEFFFFRNDTKYFVAGDILSWKKLSDDLVVVVDLGIWLLWKGMER